MKQHKLIAQFLIVLLIVPLFFFSAPKKTEAIPVVEVGHSGWANWLTSIFGGTTAAGTTVNAANSTAYNIKEFVGKPLAVMFARTVLRGITAQTVNWINTGFQGSPAYVTDPGQFFQDAGDKIAGKFITQNLGNLCSPFKAQVRIAVVQNYLNQNDKYSCTLSKIGTNFQSFARNFDQGGWDGWLNVSQVNQNNPYGAYVQAQNGLQAQIGQKKIDLSNELNQGMGFLSFKKCPQGKTVKEMSASNPNVESDDGQDSTGSGGTIDPDACTVPKETVTPGSVIESQLEGVVGSPIKQLELTNDINQIVGALMQQMFLKVVGGVQGGLRGLSQKDATTASRTFLEQMATGTPETNAENADYNSKVDKGVPSNLQPGADQLYTPPSDSQINNGIQNNDKQYTQTSGSSAGTNPQLQSCVDQKLQTEGISSPSTSDTVQATTDCMTELGISQAQTNPTQ